MSTQPVSSSTGSATSSSQYQTGDSLTSLGGSTPMQVTGLASGLDTDAIVNALMAADQEQVTNVTNQEDAVTAQNTELTDIQNALQTVANDAQALGDASLFTPTQTVTSTDSTIVNATATGSAGAVVGSYQIQVTALASASQRTFSYTSPTSADTVTIDGQQISVNAGTSADSLVSAINSNSNLDVWATVTQESSNGGPATVVLSSRQTGQPPASGYIDVSDTAGALTDTGNDIAGTDAEYTINGEPQVQYSSSNTISGASLGGSSQPTQGQGATQTIPGITLSLNGLTGSTPVTVNVSSPTVDSSSVQTALQQFVTDYNSAVSLIQTQLTQAPSSSDPTQGTLYGDADLTQLLTNMRDMMDSTLKDLSSGNDNMLDLGVSTGATTGNGAVSQSALNGDLTLDTSTLTSALQNNPNAVQRLLQSWSIQFSNLVNNEAAPGGDITTRIQGNDSQISYYATQIDNMNNANAEKQQQLVQEFADMESALAQSQSTSSWLTSQLSSLTG
ncbi:MAG TPA: flagellar filament capping protein FliD [Solirubrobacteraceae bacterium]|nr:flagellar filament capping protein FliD [Solirubrobacteraceae bacterium]